MWRVNAGMAAGSHSVDGDGEDFSCILSDAIQNARVTRLENDGCGGVSAAVIAGAHQEHEDEFDVILSSTLHSQACLSDSTSRHVVSG